MQLDSYLSDTYHQPLQDMTLSDNTNKMTPVLPSTTLLNSSRCEDATDKQVKAVTSSDKENEPYQTDSSIKAMCWDMLDSSLQTVLPNEEGVTYVVTEFNDLSTSNFPGAPDHAFEATVRINVKTKDAAEEWLQKMMEHSKCTYRHTRGRAPGLKRVLYKVDMHCQHHKKQLTPKQQDKATMAHAKPVRKTFLHETRNKKRNCPSSLKLTVMVPPKHSNPKRKHLEPFLCTHPTVFKISFNHNHPIKSAHVLSFRPVSDETKQKIFEYFQKGHTASSAYHWHETKLFLDSNEDQMSIVDRAANPNKSDFSRLYEEWRTSELGSDNGKPMFDQLQAEIDAYNAAMGSKGGNVILQRFVGTVDVDHTSDSDSEECPKKKRLKSNEREVPMVVAICTPLMSRVHQFVQQSGEMVFCDSTSTLDRFNTSLFVLSMSNACGGLPLGVIITSDEQEETVTQGLKLLQQVIPEEAFYKRGGREGPTIFMTDDSSAERNALHEVWPHARLLLCAFHFLQCKWTWLHKGANQIANQDRQILMSKTKQLVYATSELMLEQLYKQFKICEIVKKYPNYLKFIESQWSRRKEWAICYHTHLMTRGNQTNNYAEAGIQIVKELVFHRIKAYNIVQIFSFITECLELYYTRKLLSFAHNRVDRYISLKYQGMKSAGIGTDDIQKLDKANTFLVNSQTERGVKYLVDMNLGVCSCRGGQDGSPCSHQAAVAKLFGIYSVNCVSTISLTARRQLAFIALGSNAMQDNDFYASLHQQQEDETITCNDGKDGEDLTLLKALTAADDYVTASEQVNEDNGASGNEDNDDVLQQFQEFFEDMKERIKDTPIVAEGTRTFLRRYKVLTKPGTFVNARLSSALYRFGWVFGGTISRKDHSGRFRRGRRIPVNPKAAGRRRGTTSKGKAVVLQGRPKGMKLATFPKSSASLTIKKRPAKRQHSLSKNVQTGVQNAGRW